MCKIFREVKELSDNWCKDEFLYRYILLDMFRWESFI